MLISTVNSFVAIFRYLHFVLLYPVCSLLSDQNGSIFLSCSLHNCLDKCPIDCACRLELIFLFTVFSFLFALSRYDEHFRCSIHQRRTERFLPSRSVPLYSVNLGEKKKRKKNSAKGWIIKTTDQVFRGVNKLKSSWRSCVFSYSFLQRQRLHPYRPPKHRRRAILQWAELPVLSRFSPLCC